MIFDYFEPIQIIYTVYIIIMQRETITSLLARWLFAVYWYFFI